MGMNVRDRSTLIFYLANGTVATDLSATCATKWIPTRGCRRASLAIGWPATGSPVSVLSIQTCNHGIDGTAGEAYPITIATQPAGTANTLFLDGIKTDADYIRVVNTWTSGGTGAAFTDDSGTAGTSPILILKE
jgi:N-methylhydantoinase B/oxoprolinase/acetone carboxylase alpha subunit